MGPTCSSSVPVVRYVADVRGGGRVCVPTGANPLHGHVIPLPVRYGDRDQPFPRGRVVVANEDEVDDGMEGSSGAVHGLPSQFDIAGTTVGAGVHVYIIAEAGSNHDRELSKALKLVDVAAEAGCDAVKFQTFSGPDIASAHVSPGAELPAEYRQYGKNLQEFYANVALPVDFHAPIAERAAERGIAFLSSPFSEAAVDLLVEMGVPALKIASFEVVHLPLIRYAAESGLPLIISTGTARLADVEHALDAALEGSATGVALMHCGSSYPLPVDQANLRAMDTLVRAFGVPTGYSDHTTGTAVSVAAAARGAAVIEKHITLDRRAEGPDHPFALEPSDLRVLVRGVREASASVGSGFKAPTAAERDHALRGRRSIHAARDLAQGLPISADALKIVRPSSGLAPHLLGTIVGRSPVRMVPADHPVTWDDLLR